MVKVTKLQEIISVDQNQNPSIYCLQETHFKYKDAHRLTISGWRKIYHANINQKKAGVVILISDRPDFKARAGTKG